MDKNTLIHSHGTVMILAWMAFGSTGILFARYGRVLRFGNQRQFLGKSIWFQIHRFLLSISSLLTLFGFILIIISRQGQWINLNMDGKQKFAHTIMGTIVVSCVLIQIWLALYRCHPNSRFRFIFNWTHRLTGNLALLFATCNILLMAFVLSTNIFILIIIISIWSIWTIIVVILFEIIQYHYRKAAERMALNNRANSNANQENFQRNATQDIENLTNPTVENRRLNLIRSILFVLHSFISFALCIPLIVLIWQEN